MLLSRFAYECAVYGGLVAIVASAWVAIRHRERRVEPKLPPATTGRSFRRYLARIAPVIVLLALLGGEWALLSHARDAVILEAGQMARREIYVGTDPDVPRIGSGKTLVLNRTNHSVTFYDVEDGDYRQHEVEPGETAISTVDLLGPRAKPSRDDIAERRTWLTW